MTPSEWLLWRADKLAHLEAEVRRLEWAAPHVRSYSLDRYFDLCRRQNEMHEAIAHLQAAPYRPEVSHV